MLKSEIEQDQPRDAQESADPIDPAALPQTDVHWYPKEAGGKGQNILSSSTEQSFDKTPPSEREKHTGATRSTED